MQNSTFMCFSSLEKLLFFKLDRSSIDSLSIEPSFSFLDRYSTDSLSIKEFSCAICLLDSISIHQDLWVPARHIFDSFFDPLSKIIVLSVYSIDSRQILDPSRPSFSHRQILDRSSIDSLLSRFSA